MSIATNSTAAAVNRNHSSITPSNMSLSLAWSVSHQMVAVGTG